MAVILLLPSALFLGLGLASGGFFPDSVAVAVVAVLVIMITWCALRSSPFSGLGRGVSAVATALVAFAAWSLASGTWSGSPARAMFEYDRALLYASVFLLTGMLGRSARRARLLLYGVALTSTLISVGATATWLLPHVFPAGGTVGRDRLSWPTSYWNATGLIAALSLVWTSSLSCSSTASARVRVIATMAVPFPAAALIFTASRGATAVALVGLVIAVIALRSSATPGGVAALVPAIALSVAVALAVSGLNVTTPTAQAIDAGHRAVLLLLAIALAGGVMRVALVRLDTMLVGFRPPWTRRQLRAAFGTAIVLVLLAFFALGGLREARTAVHDFSSSATQSVNGRLAPGLRLTRFGGNGRSDLWRVALVDGFGAHPLLGTGAGTYATLWTRYGPTPRRVLDAHSLYLQELAELGLVGGGLVIVTIGSILVALGRRARGAEREAWAALLAGGVMWALHAGVDWDWEMPAVTAWFFAAGGLALSAPVGRRTGAASPRVRFAVAAGCLVLAVTPALAWRSQTQLIKAVRAFERGECLTAERAALASNAALDSRADPFEVLAYCEAGAGHLPVALSAIEAAEHRDPQNWELRYSEALIRAAARLDPRAAASAALTRYPTSPLTRAAVRAFSTGGPAAWRRFALSAPLPLPRTKH